MNKLVSSVINDFKNSFLVSWMKLHFNMTRVTEETEIEEVREMMGVKLYVNKTIRIYKISNFAESEVKKYLSEGDYVRLNDGILTKILRMVTRNGNIYVLLENNFSMNVNVTDVYVKVITTSLY